MTDEAQVAAPEALPQENAIPDKPVEVATPPAEPKKTPEQARSDAINKAMDKALPPEKDEAKEPEKPKAPKRDPEPDADDDSEAEEAPARPDDGDEPSEGKKPEPVARTKNDTAPDKIAPFARDKWANVPREIKAEVHRIIEAQDNDAKQYAEDREFREGMREYDELAKKAGTTVKDAMARYVDIDKRLNSQDANERARTALEVMQSSNIDVVKFARAIVQNEQQFQQAPQSRPDPAVARIEQQVQQLTQAQAQQSEAARIAPLQQAVEQFAASKPDYAALESDIADLLKTGIIQRKYPGLAADQLLAEAYRRSGGSHLTSAETQSAASVTPDEPTEPRPVNPAGRKSVSGSPSGDPRITPKKLSRSAAVEKAMREAGL